MDTWDQMPLGLQLMARHAWHSGFVRLNGIATWLHRFGYTLSPTEISAGIKRA